MFELIIFISVFICAAAAGYFIINIFINDKSYEERVTTSAGLDKLSQISSMSSTQMYQLIIMFAVFMFMLGMLFAKGNVIGGIVLGVIMATPAFFLPSIIVSYLVNKRLEKINEELPGVLEILSSSIYAGLTLNQAIVRNIGKMPAPISEEFRIIANECRLGSSLNDAMRHWAERNRLMDVKLTVIAAELALRHGGNLPETFRKLSTTIRERYMFQKEVQTLTTEGRSQAIVMTLLPFIILLIMTLLRREEMVEFLSSAIGIGSVFLVFVMQITAYLWIRKAITIDV